MARWYDDAGVFERMRQNFTTTFMIEGPNMTLEQMSQKLCQMRDEIHALRAVVDYIETSDPQIVDEARDVCCQHKEQHGVEWSAPAEHTD